MLGLSLSREDTAVKALEELLEDRGLEYVGLSLLDLREAVSTVLKAMDAEHGSLEEAWERGYRDSNTEWNQCWDLVTPDEDRFVAVNPYTGQT